VLRQRVRAHTERGKGGGDVHEVNNIYTAHSAIR
jgi:hypothetical protein